MNNAKLKYEILPDGAVMQEMCHSDALGTRRVGLNVISKEALQSLGWVLPGATGNIEELESLRAEVQDLRASCTILGIDSLHKEISTLRQQHASVFRTMTEVSEDNRRLLNQYTACAEGNAVFEQQIQKLKQTIENQGQTIGNHCNTIRARGEESQSLWLQVQEKNQRIEDVLGALQGEERVSARLRNTVASKEAIILNLTHENTNLETRLNLAEYMLPLRVPEPGEVTYINPKSAALNPESPVSRDSFPLDFRQPDHAVRTVEGSTKSYVEKMKGAPTVRPWTPRRDKPRRTNPERRF